MSYSFDINGQSTFWTFLRLSNFHFFKTVFKIKIKVGFYSSILCLAMSAMLVDRHRTHFQSTCRHCDEECGQVWLNFRETKKLRDDIRQLIKTIWFCFLWENILGLIHITQCFCSVLASVHHCMQSILYDWKFQLEKNTKCLIWVKYNYNCCIKSLYRLGISDRFV